MEIKMQAVKEKTGVHSVLTVFPRRLSEELSRKAAARRGGLASLSEIRVRSGGSASAVLAGERVALSARLTEEEISRTVVKICDGAIYTHRDSIAEGYVSVGGGIRVGIGGRASYEGERLVGVSDIRSLVFRIPTGACEFGCELLRVWQDGVGHGMLIYSPPGVGKTTALRYLAGAISRGRGGVRVCVVDERGEFMAEDYADSELELLTGYKKSVGMEIATRTLAPDVIMVDELGACDTESVMSVVRCGVPVIATAHAADIDDLHSRASIYPLISAGAFDVFVGISRMGGGYSLSVDRR